MGEKIFSLPPGSKVVGYLRDSGGPEQELSVMRQMREYEDYCRRNELRSVKVFIDEAKSGRFLKGRNSFLEMIDYLTRETKPEVDGAVAWSSARFSRDPNDAPFFRAMLRRQGYKILYVSGDVEDIGEYTPLAEAMHDVMNSKVVKQMAKEIKSGLHTSMSLGAFVGNTPTGFRRVPINLGMRRNGKPRMVSKLEAREDLAPLILKAFEMRAAGHTLIEVHQATHLFTCERPVSSYTRMLKNPIYMGTYQWDGAKIENYVPPIVPAETWRLVQDVNEAVRVQRGIHHRRRSGNKLYALTGLLYCATCKIPLVVHTSHTKYRMVQAGYTDYTYRYYTCPNYRHGKKVCSSTVRASEVETSVFAQVEKDCLTEEALAALEKRLKAKAQAGESSQASLLKVKQSQLTKVEKEVGNLVKSAHLAKFSKALAAALEQKEQDAEDLRQEIEGIKNRPEASFEVNIRQVAKQLRAALNSGDPQRIRRNIVHVVDRVYAKPKSAVVWYHEHLTP